MTTFKNYTQIFIKGILVKQGIQYYTYVKVDTYDYKFWFS